jgi:hypothetical protein
MGNTKLSSITKKAACAAELLKKLKGLVEAAGVELFRVLITRILLILGTATTAKKAPLPDPLYVYCTKMLSL